MLLEWFISEHRFYIFTTLKRTIYKDLSSIFSQSKDHAEVKKYYLMCWQCQSSLWNVECVWFYFYSQHGRVRQDVNSTYWPWSPERQRGTMSVNTPSLIKGPSIIYIIIKGIQIILCMAGGSDPVHAFRIQNYSRKYCRLNRWFHANLQMSTAKHRNSFGLLHCICFQCFIHTSFLSYILFHRILTKFLVDVLKWKDLMKAVSETLKAM